MSPTSYQLLHPAIWIAKVEPKGLINKLAPKGKLLKTRGVFPKMDLPTPEL
jgi:hypothetical protein